MRSELVSGRYAGSASATKKEKETFHIRKHTGKKLYVYYLQFVQFYIIIFFLLAAMTPYEEAPVTKNFAYETVHLVQCNSDYVHS